MNQFRNVSFSSIFLFLFFSFLTLKSRTRVDPSDWLQLVHQSRESPFSSPIERFDVSEIINLVYLQEGNNNMTTMKETLINFVGFES